MRHAILWLTLLLVPLIGHATTHAFFDISGPIQRAIMIANQVTQIGHAVTSLASLREQFGKLKEQYDHIRAQTLGEVGQLTETFTDLSSLPGQLVGAGLTWRDDFTDAKTAALVDALDLFSNDGTPLTDHWRDRMTETDTVTEQDVLGQYMDLPTRLATQAAANYRQRQEQAARRTVMNYAMNDAAAGAAGAVKSALESYETIRAQSNTSPTALQQAQVAVRRPSFLGHGLGENPMSKEVGGMVGSRRVQGAGSARTEGARRATGVGADGAAVGAGGLAPGQRWSASRKRDVVLRLLRGESLDAVSREVGLELYRLEAWQARALAGLELGLKAQAGEPLAAELDAAKRHIGELSMEIELLRERARAAECRLPLATRRSRR